MNFKKQGSFLFDKETFITKNEDLFEKHYEIIKELGSDAFSHVYQLRHKTSKEIRACKQLLKANIEDKEAFNKEINILSKWIIQI